MMDNNGNLEVGSQACATFPSNSEKGRSEKPKMGGFLQKGINLHWNRKLEQRNSNEQTGATVTENLKEDEDISTKYASMNLMLHKRGQNNEKCTAEVNGASSCASSTSSNAFKNKPPCCKAKTSTQHQKMMKDAQPRLTDTIALDCEMVGVHDAKRNMLARVSIVNESGQCLYDKFVKPTEPVTDYRTWVSGVRPQDLKNGEAFTTVQQEVAAIIKDRIVVGHAIHNDFKCLQLWHPQNLIRDTARFPVFKALNDNRAPALRELAKIMLGINIQIGEHSSVEDARVSLQLYLKYKPEWEDWLQNKNSWRRKESD